MDSFDCQAIANLFSARISRSGLAPLDGLGFAHAALPTTAERIQSLNTEIRRFPGDWTLDDEYWPEDHWVIGEDGAGNYFSISRSNRGGVVFFYDHELRRFERFSTDLERYADYCLRIEKASRDESS